ncbi:hypothetical protein KAR91_49585 [Candidatus Pacearchaeota archaeon]|nr:hypothetical protein [Candidatus Pacearchaeota archaeon]
MGANEIRIYAGDSYDGTITIENENGAKVDLTNSTGIASFKRELTDDEYAFQRKNIGAGGGAGEIEMSDPSNGQVKLHIVPSNTSGLAWGQYSYDFWVKLSSGKEYTVWTDKFIIDERVM